MSAFFKHFFYFSSGERRGIVILLIMTVLLGILPWLLPFFVQEDVFSFESFEVEEIATSPAITANKESNNNLFFFDPNTLSKDSFLLLGLSEKIATTILKYRSKVGAFKRATDFKKIYSLKEQDYKRLSPFIKIKKKNQTKEATTKLQKEQTFTLKNFNPNTATKEELLSLGLSTKVASTLANFRKKGGRFYKKEDLKLIYGLKSDTYQLLEPFIQFDKNSNPKDSTRFTPPKTKKEFAFKKEDITIDLNQANSEEWQQLYGIGPGYAKRITKFREKLGGFSSVDQVALTYGLPDSTFQKIKKQLKVSAIFRQIKINSVSTEALKKHPLIKWKEANLIINYRSQHGPFMSAQSLEEIKGIPVTKMAQLIPYFSFE